MRRSQLRFTVRWLIFAVSIIGMDVAAINWVVTAKSAITARMDRGPHTARRTYYHMYDNRRRLLCGRSWGINTGEGHTRWGRPEALDARRNQTE
jgi:hypothetical protein